MSKPIDKSKIIIQRYSEVSKEAVDAFVGRVYTFEKSAKLRQNFEWWFRIGFDAGLEPLYALYEGQIIGQAGLIPAELMIEGKARKAIWYVNFIIVPEMQRQGIGQILTNAWMRTCPIHITQCNERSFGVFKKFGWREHFQTFRFALPLNIYKVAKSKGVSPWKSLTLKIATPLYRGLHWFRTRGTPVIDVVPLRTLSAAGLLQWFREPGSLRILRDQAWIQWRLFDSPFLPEYYFASNGQATIIFRVFVHEDLKRFHLLYVYAPGGDTRLSALLDGLIRWAVTEKVDLIWGIANTPELCKILKKKFLFQDPVRFAYHCNVDSVNNLMSRNMLPLQAVDTDFDLMYS
jgi:GNAT superfamily N-acetyltransferase